LNLRETILEEHSRAQSDKIIKWVGEDKKRFAELVHLFLNDEYRVVQRAGWPMSDIAIKHPGMVKPYIGKFVKLFRKKGMHEAVIRNVLRVMQFVDVPAKYHGEVVNACFDFLLKSEYPIAYKAFSMTVLLNITRKEPELKRELKIVIEEIMKEGSPAIKARGRMVLKKLGKNS
jgi:dihydroorotase